MADLLSWLTDAIGSSQGQDATGTGAMLGQTMPPTPPGATPSAPPPPAPAPGAPPTPPMPPAGAAPPLPPPTQVAGNPGQPPGMPPTPPSAVKPIVTTPPPNPMPVSTPPTPPAASPAAVQNTPPAPDSQPQSGISIIGRALGLDRNSDREMASHFAGGFKGVAQNWNKPGLAAFSGAAGTALESGGKAQDKVISDQHQALSDAINAVQVGDKRALMKAQTEKSLADAQATMEGKNTKDSVMNSQQQLYIRAVEMANKDQSLAGLRYQVQRAAQGGDPNEIKQAQDALTNAYNERVKQHAAALGLDPNKLDSIKKAPGMTQDNPVPKTQMNSQKAYDALAPGSYFVNPKDGKVLQKPMAPIAPPAGAAPAAAPAGGAAPAPAAPVAPATPPIPTTPTPSKQASKDDDDDDDES